MAELPEDYAEKAPPERKSQSSGDQSGVGRQRRDDTEVYPQHRSKEQMGTHGGPARGSPKRSEGKE